MGMVLPPKWAWLQKIRTPFAKSWTLNRLEADAMRLITIACTLAGGFTRRPLSTVANFCGMLNFRTVRAVTKITKITHYMQWRTTAYSGPSTIQRSMKLENLTSMKVTSAGLLDDGEWGIASMIIKSHEI